MHQYLPFVTAIIAMLLTATASHVTAQCGVISFPNGSFVDLTGYAGLFTGKLTQTGTYPGDYTWTVSPCAPICGGSAYMSQPSGGDECYVKINTMAQSPTANGNIIVMSFGPTYNALSTLSWSAHLRLLCSSSSNLAVVGSEYVADVSASNATTYWTLTDSIFCAGEGSLNYTTTEPAQELPVGADWNAGAIVGAVAGGICICLLLVGVVIRIRQVRRNAALQNDALNMIPRDSVFQRQYGSLDRVQGYEETTEKQPEVAV